MISLASAQQQHCVQILNTTDAQPLTSLSCNFTESSANLSNSPMNLILNSYCINITSSEGSFIGLVVCSDSSQTRSYLYDYVISNSQTSPINRGIVIPQLPTEFTFGDRNSFYLSLGVFGVVALVSFLVHIRLRRNKYEK